ncbi:ABC transporter ATP-binding protein [Ruoffia tabacinasalis]|uniref:Multidrug resistance ABC transporter ATP-binding and permease protein n=1 Tax=Ruoffia tabacinasalis TaxID=87458 RepID=A0A5R9DTA5_9LACT|nr:ABC transporter ATP-binding protein [Ruoffia tabacinasalis]TLQ38885.1 ABC transporter ATP-binding protein [Ruoffia tabacinasalis]
MRRINHRELDREINEQPPVITLHILKRIYHYLKPYTFQVVLMMVIILLAALLGMLPAILTGRIIDEGFIGGDFNQLTTLISTSFIVLLLTGLIGLTQSFLGAWLSQNIGKDMRNQMYDHLQKLSQGFYASGKQGEIITRMTSDISGVQSFVTGTLTQTVSNLAVLITSIVAMIQLNWVLALVSMLIVPLLVFPIKIVGKKRWALTNESQDLNDDANEILNETLSVSGQQLVKLFTKEETEYQRYRSVNEQLTQVKVKETTVGRWFRMVAQTFIEAGPMFIYLAGGIMLLINHYQGLTVGDITILVALTTRMYRPLMQLMDIHIEFIRSLALFNRIFNYLDMPIEIKNNVHALSPKQIKGDLSFNNVSFHYKEDTRILHDISFQVKEGETLAIVGPSGAGKSTLFNLIPRLYDVIGGEIKLDDYNIQELDLHFLRQNVGLVTQETYLFNASIRENLLYAKSDATQEELIKACKEANIHNFIMNLPDGYDTEVGNRGIKLSGGEKQRISIARVFLKDPKILILDEATSSLDSISEGLIQDALSSLIKNKTSLVIAHRLSTIISADKILVLDNGHIVERGTHQQLLENDGMYKLMYETQFKPYINDTQQLASA